MNTIRLSRDSIRCSVDRIHMTHQDRKRRRQQMVEMLQRGETIYSVARHFDVCISTICNAAKEFGVMVGTRRSYHTLEVLADLLNTAMTQDAIAKKHRCDKHFVRKVRFLAQQVGIQVTSRPRGRPRKKSNEDSPK